MNLEIVVAFLIGITFLLFVLLIIQNKRIDFLNKRANHTYERLEFHRDMLLSIERTLVLHEDLFKIMLYGPPQVEQESSDEEDESEVHDEVKEKILLN
jgi:hypothetical protein